MIKNINDEINKISEALENLGRAVKQFAKLSLPFIQILTEMQMTYELRVKQRKVLILKSLTMGLTYNENKRLQSL